MIVALARAFGWSYRDIAETPYYILLGCFLALAEERERERYADNPEWQEWLEHGKEWVMAQWPKAGCRSSSPETTGAP
ncbi:MAG: hypothetical protein ACPLRW_07150 [Moorellales bacterium]